jgi:hypothetical protein
MWQLALAEMFPLDTQLASPNWKLDSSFQRGTQSGLSFLPLRSTILQDRQLATSF